MRKVSILPSMITLGNLTAGFASVILATDSRYELAAWMILLGMVFDLLDGQVARLTRTAGTFGAQLDSLCDVVTFGMAPAVLVNRMSLEIYYGRVGMPGEMQKFVWLASVLYVVCAALRLARFNLETGVEEEDHEHFYGLPSPAAAGQIAALVILNSYIEAKPLNSLPEYPLVMLMPFVALVTGLLMVTRVKYVHMGDRLFHGAQSFRWFMGLIFLCILMALRGKVALAALFTTYTLVGLVKAVRGKLFPRAVGGEPAGGGH